MSRFLYDTNVFVYAFGADHVYRAPCREVVGRAATGELRGEASVDLLQEFLHQRLRQTGDRGRAVRTTRDVAKLCDLHSMQARHLPHALVLYERTPGLDARDALFAALALAVGIESILSADQAFDRVPGLMRVDPADADAVAALAR